MALFDFFRKRKPAVSMPQLCYDIAYFILPQYALGDYQKDPDICQQSPASAGPFFYVLACQMHKMEPDIEAAKMFKGHAGKLADGRTHFTLEYPAPPPVDLGTMTPEQLVAARELVVLAPHFSCIIRNPDQTSSYFILGQAPMGGGTTLRCVTAEGANCNLGPGPAPTLRNFLSCLSDNASGNGE